MSCVRFNVFFWIGLYAYVDRKMLIDGAVLKVAAEILIPKRLDENRQKRLKYGGHQEDKDQNR
jgi:hypothetical protein